MSTKLQSLLGSSVEHSASAFADTLKADLKLKVRSLTVVLRIFFSNFNRNPHDWVLCMRAKDFPVRILHSWSYRLIGLKVTFKLAVLHTSLYSLQ